MKIIALLPQVNGMVYNHQTYVMKIEKNQLQLPAGTGGGGRINSRPKHDRNEGGKDDPLARYPLTYQVWKEKVR